MIRRLLKLGPVVLAVGCTPVHISSHEPAAEANKSELIVFRASAFNAGAYVVIFGADHKDFLELGNDTYAELRLFPKTYEFFVRTNDADRPYRLTIELKQNDRRCLETYPNPNRLLRLPLFFLGNWLGSNFLLREVDCPSSDKLASYLQLGAPSSEVAGDWNIWMLASSGRGGKSGIFIDSKARNVAFVETAGHDLRDLAEDFRRGVPSSFCETLPLSENQVRDFAFRIAGIPDEVLAKGSLEITSACADEPRIGVTLTMHGRRLYFGYSLVKSCRGQEVPDWLTGLVNALWARQREIKVCSTTTSTPAFAQ